MPEISTENFHLFLLAQTILQIHPMLLKHFVCLWTFVCVKKYIPYVPFHNKCRFEFMTSPYPYGPLNQHLKLSLFGKFFLVLLSQFFCAPFNFAAVQKTYLVWFCMNILGRHLISGNLKQEVVFDIVDRKCMHIFGSVLGWKYLNAQEVSFT